MGTPSGISLGSDGHSVDDSLPSFLSHNLISRNNNLKTSSKDSNIRKFSPRNVKSPSDSIPTSPKSSKNPVHTISFDALLDKSLNYSQKERISEAILKGTIPLESYQTQPGQSQGQGEGQGLTQSQQQHQSLRSKRMNEARHEWNMKSHADAHSQRHIYNQKLLGVVSQPALLLPPELKDKQHEIERKKYLIQSQSEYRWGPRAVPVVPLHVPKSRLSETSKEPPEGYMTRAEIIAESKK